MDSVFEWGLFAKKSCQTEGILTRTPMGSLNAFIPIDPSKRAFYEIEQSISDPLFCFFLTPLWQLLLKCVSRHSPEVCPKGADTYKHASFSHFPGSPTIYLVPKAAYTHRVCLTEPKNDPLRSTKV